MRVRDRRVIQPLSGANWADDGAARPAGRARQRRRSSRRSPSPLMSSVGLVNVLGGVGPRGAAALTRFTWKHTAAVCEHNCDKVGD